MEGGWGDHVDFESVFYGQLKLHSTQLLHALSDLVKGQRVL